MTFQSGQSGNPAGRPRGARGKATIVAEAPSAGEAEAIMRTVRELAKAGDLKAAGVCLNSWLRAGLTRLSSSFPRATATQAYYWRLSARLRSLHAACDAIEAARSQRAQVRNGFQVLTLPEICSHFVPMTVTTLGQAWRLGWRLRARCFWLAPGAKSKEGRKQVQCETTTELDMKTLVWTRGELFPLDQLESRLKCPRCGSRRVTVVFEIPNQPQAARR